MPLSTTSLNSLIKAGYRELAFWDQKLTRELEILKDLSNWGVTDFRIKYSMNLIVHYATMTARAEIGIEKREAELAARVSVRSQIKPFGQ